MPLLKVTTSSSRNKRELKSSRQPLTLRCKIFPTSKTTPTLISRGVPPCRFRMWCRMLAKMPTEKSEKVERRDKRIKINQITQSEDGNCKFSFIP